ncbi:MAG TPA: tetratricopeptide repeat protein, partial [Herpetosiphonaceae bacterium]|nr:tetratricopeptide repeat protein [Herpetosiphonaceae bacterium]
MASLPPSQPQDQQAGPWIRKYLAALQADPALQPPQGGSLPVWLEQQIDPAIERGQPTPPRVMIQNAVTRSPAMVLLGPSGSGKSTLLRQLVRELAQEAATDPHAPLPLYVPLAFFVGSIEGTLATQARMRGPSLATLALARPCFLVVDALNDLPAAEQIPVLSMLRRALTDLGPNARWIIACRSEAWGLFDAWFAGNRFQVWRARPWSDQTILNAAQRQGTPAMERLLRLPGAIELARRPRWLGAFLQLREDALPGPLLLKWIEMTALEAARTHCLSDQCAESALVLLGELGALLARQPALNRATIASVVADTAGDAKLVPADLQALLEALALLHPAGDDEWVFRSPLLSDLHVALELHAVIARQGSHVGGADLAHAAKSPTRLALLYGLLTSPQPILRSLIRTGAWEATQQVLDANVAPEEALAVLEETGQIDKDVGAALGRTWAHSGSAEVAVALLEWTVRDGRDDPYLFGLLGHLHRQSGNLLESRTAFQEALRRDPANFDYQQALAQVCHELGESDTATATLEGLLTAHHGRLAAAAFHLGSLREEQGRLQEALEQYSHAAALCPRTAPDCNRYLLAKARVLRRLGRHEDASQILRSIEATGDPVALADENAALLEATGHDQQALDRLGQIESLGSATPTTYLRMAELHRRRDEADAAERAFRAAAELDPRCEAAYEGIVELARERGDLPTAISACKQLVDLRPQSGDSWRRLGALQREDRQYAESATSLKTALRISASSETQLELARTRWAQGDQPTALSHYRSAALDDRDGRMSAEAGW